MRYSVKVVWLFIVVMMFNEHVCKSQFYSGTYKSVSQTGSFRSLEVDHESDMFNPFEGNLAIKAFTSSDKKKSGYWDFSASTEEELKSIDLQETYGQSDEILGIFNYDLFMDGCYFDYHILTFQDQDDKTQLLMVEEIYSTTLEKSQPIEVNTVLWAKVR